MLDTINASACFNKFAFVVVVEQEPWGGLVCAGRN